MKHLMDKPVLTIGVIFFALFVYDLNRRGYLDSFKNRFQPTSCFITLKALEKKLPKEAVASCDENHLIVDWKLEMGDFVRLEKPEMILAANYRELANNLTFIAKNSPVDLLAGVSVVTVNQEGKDFILSAVSEGRYLVKLSELKSPELIAEHLKNTVKVKESVKR